MDVLRVLPHQEEDPLNRETMKKIMKTKNPIKIKSLVTCLQLTLKLKLQPILPQLLKLKLQPLLPQLLKLKLVLCLQLQCHPPTK